MNNLIIGGIDPGTTLAIALIDLNGKILNVESFKEHDLSSVIKKVIDYGKIVVVGCDKKKVPSFVEKFARKLGARTIKPRYDLLVSEKKEIVGNYPVKNDHERDALASAVYAFTKLGKAISGIDKFFDRHKDIEVDKIKVKELILSNEDMSITAAVDMVKEKKKIVNEKKKIIIEEDPKVKKLKEIIKRQKKTIDLLEKQKQKTRKEMDEVREKYSYLRKKVDTLQKQEKYESLLRLRDERIISLARETETKTEMINDLQDEISKLNKVILSIEDKYVLKKLRNLGFQEVENKIKLLEIEKDDMLYVDDPNIFSRNSIKLLKGKIKLIITEKKVNNILQKEFIFIPEKDLDLIKDQHFVLVDKKELDKKIKKVDILKRVVDEYKEAREY